MQNDFYVKNMEIIKDRLQSNIKTIEKEILSCASSDVKWLFSQYIQMQSELKKLKK